MRVSFQWSLNIFVSVIKNRGIEGDPYLWQYAPSSVDELLLERGWFDADFESRIVSR